MHQTTDESDITDMTFIGVRANFFSRGAEPSLPENFFDSAQENCYAKLQNYFVRLTPPSI